MALGSPREDLGASKAIGAPAPTVTGKSVLGVVSANSNFLIETVPSPSNSHSVAADSKRI